MNFSQVHGQPCQEDVHDVVDDHELDADSPELGRAEELMPGSDGFLQGISRTAFVDVCCFFSIDIGTVCRIVAGEAVPDPGQGDADETEDEEDSVPAEEAHEGDRCDRADDGAEEGS